MFEQVRILIGSVVLDDTFQQSAFGLSSVVGRAVWFRAFCVVDYVVLVMWIGFVFDRKVGAKFFGVVDNLHLVVWVVKRIGDGFLHFLHQQFSFLSSIREREGDSLVVFQGLILFVQCVDSLCSFSVNDVINHFVWIVVEGGEYFL